MYGCFGSSCSGWVRGVRSDTPARRNRGLGWPPPGAAGEIFADFMAPTPVFLEIDAHIQARAGQAKQDPSASRDFRL